MKKMKKLLSMLMAATMTLAMAAPSFAAAGDPGKITIPNATLGEDYAAYKIFEANPNGTDIAYIATEYQAEQFGGDMSPFEFTETASGYYNVALKDRNTEGDAIVTFLQKFDLENTQLFTKEAETLDAEEVKIEWNVPYGYYYVTSSLGTAVSINSTNREVEILDKNQTGPNWGDNGGKKITDVDGDGKTTTAHYGQVIPFDVKFDTTNYNGEKIINNYYVTDTLAKGMSYVTKKDNDNDVLDVVVKVGDSTLDADKYTVDYTKAADENQQDTFTITIPWYDEETETTEAGFRYASPNAITVSYKATVDTDAEIDGEGNVNKASFTYTTLNGDNNEREENKSEEKEATTYTYALAIHKVNESNENLAGATFTLTKDGTAINVTETAESGTYLYDENATSNVVVSPASGLIIIKGVEKGSYTLTETKAPEGYNLLDENVTIEAAVDSTKTSITKIYYDKDGNIIDTVTEENQETVDESKTVDIPVSVYLSRVTNVAGTRLPSTGGIGTTIFYAAGIILMAGAVFFVVRRKRA